MLIEIENAYRGLLAGIALQAIHDATKVKPIATYSPKVRTAVKAEATEWLSNHGYGAFEWLDVDDIALDDSLYRLLDCSQ